MSRKKNEPPVTTETPPSTIFPQDIAAKMDHPEQVPVELPFEEDVDLAGIEADAGEQPVISDEASEPIEAEPLPEQPPSFDAECMMLKRHVSNCECTGDARKPIAA